MVKPNKDSAVLDVICIASIDTTLGDLVLSNRSHWTGLEFIWLLPNQLKTFAEVACNSEMTVGMSVAHENGLCHQHNLQYDLFYIHKVGQ